jgi:hypothetical protein
MNDKNWLANKLSFAFKILAGLSGVLGVVFFLIILIGGGSPQAPRSTSFLALVLGILYGVLLLTISEVLRLLMSIEQNTRRG